MTDVPKLSSVVYEEELHAGRNIILCTYIYTLYQKKTCKIVTLWNFYKQLRADHFGRSSSSNVKEDSFISERSRKN